MKTLFSILTVIFLILPVTITAQVKNNQLREFISEINSGNHKFPQKMAEGIWLMGMHINEKDKVLIQELGFESKIIKVPKAELESLMNKLSSEFIQTVAKSIHESEMSFLIDLGFSYQFTVRNFETKEVLFSKRVSAEELKVASKETDFLGSTPLSYYKKGFENQNKYLPMDLGEGITLDYISFIDNKLQYECSVDKMMGDFLLKATPSELEQIKKVGKTEIINELVSQWKTTENFAQDMVKYNIQICYRYYQKETNKFLYEINITPAEYSNHPTYKLYLH